MSSREFDHHRKTPEYYTPARGNNIMQGIDHTAENSGDYDPTRSIMLSQEVDLIAENTINYDQTKNDMLAHELSHIGENPKTAANAHLTSLPDDDEHTIKCICIYADDDGNTLCCSKCSGRGIERLA
ncbi:uncharacterized protein Z519_08636 [Cladophialophora bantiana CBS 173.52]|uniref:Uncharacterized protein n=1 Tax=Cladophialophora bantiana (strain ATCC 10958 / CBS 173.52 / CDC B-1940 / NIH 8579) TaxID=1442370 RepID=A0A0D2HC30_CLAB1|nr:uncharacterized protein Z519_08636 [Cladophialophora bantiana CBS 173.52]KIW90853.1 hypothetical protein Z519_08636 [Cladophialophora bantiana CBS 173.52]